MDDLSVVAQRA